MLSKSSQPSEERGFQIRDRLTHLYPFLTGTDVKRTVFQSVVNVASSREIRLSEHPHRLREGLFWAVATKWTNAITTSLELIMKIQQQSLERGIICEQELLFPEGRLDLAYISDHLSFRHETYNYEKALAFADMWKFPHQMIPKPSLGSLVMGG